MTRKLDLPILRLGLWPATDQAAWHAASYKGDWFVPGRALGRLGGGRIRSIKASYGRWIGFLATTEPDLVITSGLPLFTLDRVRSFYNRLCTALAPLTVRHYMYDLWTVARAMAPNRSFEHLGAATRHILMTAESIMDPHERIVPARDLFAVGFTLMRTAHESHTLLREIEIYRDGLMIAILTAVPLRLGNLAALEIDRHLTKHGVRYRISFAAFEVKNRQPLDYPLPESLTPWINQYIEQYRPILLGRCGYWRRGDPGQALWLSRDGTQLKPGSIHNRITTRTCKWFGFPINPHRFRHIAATSTAVEMPEHIAIVHSVLGHNSPQTSERHYNQAHSLEAGRRYQSVVEELLAEQDGTP